MSDFFITPQSLCAVMATAQAPLIFDVRRRHVYDAADTVIPGAVWRDTFQVAAWKSDLEKSRPIVVACVHGEEMSQSAVTHLRSDGFDARALQGGYDAWTAANLPLVAKKPSP